MNKLRAGVELRKEMALELFKRVLFGVTQSLAETSTTLYHGNKADILKRFTSIDQHNEGAISCSHRFISNCKSHRCHSLQNFL